MRLRIEFEQTEIEKVKTLVAEKITGDRQMIRYRLKNNVVGQKPLRPLTNDTLWQSLMMCLLTTQQRSGPNSPVNKLMEQKPFPLGLESCCQFGNIEEESRQILANAGGIRRTNKIAEAISINFSMLEAGEWGNVRNWTDQLMKQRELNPMFIHRDFEEEAAGYMENFREFGPKQARNFWQALGLTRYVFVLDSRIVRWLRQNLQLENGLLTSDGLGDSGYYRFISDILLDLCLQVDVLPCVLDAIIFDSFDEGSEWKPDTVW